MNSTKRKGMGLLSLFMGLWIAYVQIDGYYQKTLTDTQQTTMTISTLFLVMMGTFYLMPKMNGFKDFFTKDIINRIVTILFGIYLSWIAIDCFYEQTLEIERIRGIGAIGLLTIVSGYYALMKTPKAQ